MVGVPHLAPSCLSRIGRWESWGVAWELGHPVSQSGDTKSVTTLGVVGHDEGCSQAGLCLLFLSPQPCVRRTRYNPVAKGAAAMVALCSVGHLRDGLCGLWRGDDVSGIQVSCETFSGLWTASPLSVWKPLCLGNL